MLMLADGRTEVEGCEFLCGCDRSVIAGSPNWALR